MAGELVLASDLVSYPGSPFSADVVASAAESVRSDAGWHIAPVVTETVILDGTGSKMLLLPTLKVVAVTEVRVWENDAWTVRTGWRIGQSGTLVHDDRWCYGLDSIQVDLQHGYTQAPADLLPIIAARCQRAQVDAILTQRSETVGQRTASESYNINRLEIEAKGTLPARYRLVGRVV